MSEPKVEIIILNWNGWEDTIECIESLEQINYSNYGIIVVDNASSGDDVKILRERFGDRITVIENDLNSGFPEGCNIGMRHALKGDCEYILLLNNDTTVDPQFLTELVKITEEDQKVGIVGSKILYYHRRNRIQAAGGRIIWRIGYIGQYGKQEDYGQYDGIYERDYVFGTSLLLSRKLVEDIGLMDPYYYFGVEEYDYCMRTRKAGYKVIYTSFSKVWHKVGASKAKLDDYPETQEIIRKSAGIKEYKYIYHLFWSYCPPVLNVIAFIGYLFWSSIVGQFFVLVKRGDWVGIEQGFLRRIKRTS